MKMPEKCPDCGAPVGGREECQKLFDEVIAREFSSPAYFGVHRITVDCYALQPPDRYCASFKSFAAHLSGLCCAARWNTATIRPCRARYTLDSMDDTLARALHLWNDVVK